MATIGKNDYAALGRSIVTDRVVLGDGSYQDIAGVLGFASQQKDKNLLAPDKIGLRIDCKELQQ